jgi:hypothetical protein
MSRRQKAETDEVLGVKNNFEIDAEKDADGQEPIENFQRQPEDESDEKPKLTEVQLTEDHKGNPFLPDTGPVVLVELDELLKKRKNASKQRAAWQKIENDTNDEILEIVKANPKHLHPNEKNEKEYHGKGVSLTLVKKPETITLKIEVEKGMELFDEDEEE